MTAPRKLPPAAAPREATYTISQLAGEFALTTRAIRFYEDEGLLAPRRVVRPASTASASARGSS